MSVCSHRPDAATPALIDAGLRHLGYLPGAPAHVPAEAVAIDRRVYRATRCGSCGRRGLRFTPWHRGHQYRGLATCPRCGHTEEA
jgi:hypothetical protein